jgi:hypothetical protein
VVSEVLRPTENDDACNEFELMDGVRDATGQEIERVHVLVKNLCVTVIDTGEGVVVDVWGRYAKPVGEMGYDDECLATLAVLFGDAYDPADAEEELSVEADRAEMEREREAERRNEEVLEFGAHWLDPIDEREDAEISAYEEQLREAAEYRERSGPDASEGG